MDATQAHGVEGSVNFPGFWTLAMRSSTLFLPNASKGKKKYRDVKHRDSVVALGVHESGGESGAVGLDVKRWYITRLGILLA